MDAVALIVMWGLVALVAAVAGARIASGKKRSSSAWSAWCLLIPPLVLVIWALPPGAGAPAEGHRAKDTDEDDMDQPESPD